MSHSPAAEPGGGYSVESDLSYYPAESRLDDAYLRERCRLDLYHPTAQTGYPTVVWFHGGGLKGGNKYIPESLQEQDLAVAAVNYRLSPQATSPAYIEDAAAAVAWVFQNIATYGGDPDAIFVAGHSAGGYLTSMVGLDKHYLARYGIDADRIAGLFPYSGQSITHSTIREERGVSTQQAVVDAFAPLNHIRSDAPPIVLITGDRDLELPARYEENALLWKMLLAAGHPDVLLFELDGFNHGTMVEPGHLLLLRHLQRIREDP